MTARLGAPLAGPFESPQAWIAAVREAGYTAAYAPVPTGTADATVDAYAAAAEAAGIIISEVGAWSNPIDPDPVKAQAAREKCIAGLALADRLGARCCVNIAGSRSPTRWDGPHPANFSAETFEAIVETSRTIIDAVKPSRTTFTLETMPWIFPATAEHYLDLVKAIDRPAMAVHLDPVNMVSSPELAYDTGKLVRHCFEVLGPRIVGCHVKDLVLRDDLTVHIEERAPGLGNFDLATYLREVDRLPGDIPFMLEHLPQEAYPAAVAHVRGLAGELGIKL
jgi:sugar phosphate isomerase/epimerase